MTVDDTYSIIVIYNAVKSTLDETTNSLKKQGSKVILVVNDAKRYDTVHADKIIYNKKNLGIAEAQNIGIKLAVRGGATHVAIFDQDSEVPNNYLNLMNMALLSAKSQVANIGLITPRIYDVNMKSFVEPRVYAQKQGKLFINMPNKLDQKVFAKEEIRLAAKPIASGSIVPIGTFYKVGLMDKKLFIDLVDTDFDLRILLAGMNIIQANNVVLKHKIGARKLVKFGRLNFWPTNHSAARRYTIARNTVWMWKRYHKVAKGMTRETFRTLISTLVYIQFEDKTFEKSKAFLKGLIEGVIGDGK